MKQVLTVFQYTFKEGIRKKAFWVSTIIIMALILLLCLAPRIWSAFDKSEEGSQEPGGQTEVSSEKEGICYFIDETGVFEKHMEAFQALYPELEFKSSKTKELSALKEDVAKNEKNSILYIEDQEGVPFIHVVNTNFMKGIDAGKAGELSTKIWQAEFLTDQGVSAENIAAAQVPLGYAEEAAGEMNLTGYVLGLVMTFVMFFAVYYYGYGVAMSVASEKTSRVMETLIISAKPSRILLGKCLAMGTVGLLQMGGLLAFGLACYGILMPDGFQINGIEISLSGFGADTILVLILYETYADSIIAYLQGKNPGKELFVYYNLSLILFLVNSAAKTVSAPTTDTFPEIIQYALSYIEKYYCEDISVSLIAESLSISTSRLCHIFKDFMGIR